MRTDNRDSEKDLNANPESTLNSNKPVSKPERFPESHEAKGEMEKQKREHPDDANRSADLELLAAGGDAGGTVSARETGSNPEDIAGVSDLDRGMRRAKRR